MSQGTPTREGRIERHLMRQRGAGVRTITADFGFSFALPTVLTVDQLQLPTEPPAKRRKTNGSISPARRSDVSAIRKKEIRPEILDKDLEAGHNATQPCGRLEKASHGANWDKDTTGTDALPENKSPRPSKKQAVGARRKLRLDDAVEYGKQQKCTAPNTGDLEDTFIFSPKPKKRQTKRMPEEAVIAKMSNPDPPKKRGRPPKVKVQPVAVVERLKKDNEVKKIEDDTASIELPRKRGRPRKGKEATALTKTREQPTTDTKERVHDDPVSVANAGCEITKQKSKVTRKRATEVVAEVEPEPTNIKFVGTDVANVDPINIMPVIAESVTTEADETEPARTKSAKGRPVRTRPASQKTTKRSNAVATASDKVIDTIMSEKAAKRPRRQAAISAIEKVTLGYEEDLIPVDKLRRAPDVSIKSKRSRKVALCETTSAVLSNSSPSRPSIAKKETLGCEEVPLPAAQPLKRGRKTTSKTAKSGDEQTHQELDETDPCATEHESSTKQEEPAPGKEPSRPKAPTAKRGRKPGTKAVKADIDSVDVQPEAAELEINSRAEQASADFDPKEAASKASETRPKREEQDAETEIVASSGTTTKKQSTKPRRALADFDANVVRKSSNRGTKEKSSTKRKDTSHSASKCRDVTMSPTNEPPHEKSSVSKKRHMKSTDEDLDWLFESPETHTKRSRPAVVRQPGTKTRRKEPEHGAKDMDLDNLLASIAGFSGKLLTGKRGRAMAS